MKIIYDYHGDKIYLDEEDFLLFGNITWTVQNFNSNLKYATRMELTSNIKKYLHKEIYYKYNLPKYDYIIDHIDGNGLNNQKENLRLVTKSQSQYNRGKQINNTSGYKGVSWYNKINKWVAEIKYEHIKVYLGAFKNKEDAVKARKEAEIKYHGEFARKE